MDAAGTARDGVDAPGRQQWFPPGAPRALGHLSNAPCPGPRWRVGTSDALLRSDTRLVRFKEPRGSRIRASERPMTRGAPAAGHLRHALTESFIAPSPARPRPRRAARARS